MCICIDCKWIDRCKAYHAVEKQHGAEHLNLSPDYEPKEPIIHISVIEQEKKTAIEWDVQTCKSFDLDEGKWKRLRPNQKVPS